VKTRPVNIFDSARASPLDLNHCGNLFTRYGYRFDIGGYFRVRSRRCALFAAWYSCPGTLEAFLRSRRLELLASLFRAGAAPVIHGFVWQPFTYIFLHAGVLHVLLNLLFLAMFGADWNTRGRAAVLRLFLFVRRGRGHRDGDRENDSRPEGLEPPPSPRLGLRRHLWGAAGLRGDYAPQAGMGVPAAGDRVDADFRARDGAIEFFGTIGDTGDNVSHVCHLGGMLVGYVYLRRGSFLYNYRNYFSDWKRRRLKKKFEVYVRDHRDKPPRVLTTG